MYMYIKTQEIIRHKVYTCFCDLITTTTVNLYFKFKTSFLSFSVVFSLVLQGKLKNMEKPLKNKKKTFKTGREIINQQ